MDVTPLSLSIETVGGVATRLIERNTTIPTRHSQIFSTAMNGQTSVEIKVLQGERPFARDNTLLGNFRLNGIRRAPAGVPQIEVTFDIDANGIVNVSAKDLDTGRYKDITITASSNLSEEDIQRAIRDAQEYASTDSTRKEHLNCLNEANVIALKAEQYLSSERKTMDKDVRKELKTELSALQKLTRGKRLDKLTESDVAAITVQTEKVRNMIPE